MGTFSSNIKEVEKFESKLEGSIIIMLEERLYNHGMISCGTSELLGMNTYSILRDCGRLY